MDIDIRTVVNSKENTWYERQSQHFLPYSCFPEVTLYDVSIGCFLQKNMIMQYKENLASGANMFTFKHVMHPSPDVS